MNNWKTGDLITFFASVVTSVSLGYLLFGGSDGR